MQEPNLKLMEVMRKEAKACFERGDMEDGRELCETIFKNLIPHLIEQSKKWNENKIKKALKKTYKTELEIKSSSSIRKDLLIKNLIVDLCVTANSAS